MPQYARLRELLENESFPHSFTFKFVGNQTPAFEGGLGTLEAGFPSLKQAARRPSDQGRHLAMTYVLVANKPEEIVEVYRKIAEIPDLILVL